MIRCTKNDAIKLVVQTAPKYLEFYREFQAFDRGWLRWPERLIDLRKKLNIENYVILYDDERRIGNAFLLFLYGEKGLKEWNESLKSLSSEEQQAYINEYTQELIELDDAEIESLFPVIPESGAEEAQAQNDFLALPEEERLEQSKRLAFFLLFFFSSLHNYFSVMTCGEKMTSLVPKAVGGDDDAFLKAIQIDRHLLKAHPYFIERHARALQNGEIEFLNNVSYRLTNPHLRGKIIYPGIYVVFAILEVMGWLDDLSHEEILDICDAAGLDRWQNRIEDVNYLTKRLAGYRRYQKTKGVSMH